MSKIEEWGAEHHLCAECGLPWPDPTTAWECARLDLAGLTEAVVVAPGCGSGGCRQRVP